jgi:hypothetical protein
MSHRSRGGGTYVPVPSRGDCPTRKVEFASRKQARAAARSMNDSALSVYRCPDCEWFHVGHLPQRVRNGAVDRRGWEASLGGAR